jgi:hypothetical protein
LECGNNVHKTSNLYPVQKLQGGLFKVVYDKSAGQYKVLFDPASGIERQKIADRILNLLNQRRYKFDDLKGQLKN